MANVFANVGAVARISGLYLAKNLGILSRVNRQIEGEYQPGVGGTVTVRTQNRLSDAGLYTHPTVTVTDVQETTAQVVVSSHYYKAVQPTAAQRRLEIRDFAQQVMFPAIDAMMATFENLVIRELVGNAARNLVGTAGNEPSTLAHITAGVKKLKDLFVPRSAYQGLITTAAWANFATASQFTSRDFGENRAREMQVGALGGVVGVREFFESNYCGTFDQGDVAGTVLVNGAAVTSAAFTVDGFTAATGTVKKGTRLTVAGVAGTYTVSADAAIAGNAATLVLVETLASTPADNAAVTFQTAFKENVVYHPDGIAVAIIPPVPNATNSAIQMVDGVGLKVSTLQVGLLETFAIEALFGQKTITPASGVVFQG